MLLMSVSLVFLLKELKNSKWNKSIFDGIYISIETKNSQTKKNEHGYLRSMLTGRKTNDRNQTTFLS